MKLIEFYEAAKKCCIDYGYLYEIEVVNNRQFGMQTAIDFFKQYVYVILNSGMKNQVAEKIWKNYALHGIKAINHPGKREAIVSAEKNYKKWFKELQGKETVEEKLSYLESLPWIGPITKYHLARNLGIDVAKPDRHLSRIANYFGCDDVQKMCGQLSEQSGDRIGVVDVVLWRATVLKKGNFEEIINES